MRLHAFVAAGCTLAAFLAPLAGCGHGTAPIFPFSVSTAASDLLRVETRADRSLVLHSLATEPLYYFVVERETLALIDWVPCTDPSTCPSVPAGGSTIVTPDHIASWHEGAKEGVVYYWRLVPKDPHSGGGFAPDSIRHLVVRL